MLYGSSNIVAAYKEAKTIVVRNYCFIPKPKLEFEFEITSRFGKR